LRRSGAVGKCLRTGCLEITPPLSLVSLWF
jgi:hypothetical protein